MDDVHSPGGLGALAQVSVTVDGAQYKKGARRSLGTPFKLSTHYKELEGALGLSPTIGENTLLEDIAERNFIAEGGEGERVPCYGDGTIEVNKSQCLWCKSSGICDNIDARLEGGRMNLVISHHSPEDYSLLKEFVRDELLSSPPGDEHSKNLRYFFFDERSRFVFSKKNTLERDLFCLPLHSTEVMIQPIIREARGGNLHFTPKMSYCPPLRRSLTVFETQVLNCLNVHSNEGTTSLKCEDLVSSVIIPGGVRGRRIKEEIVHSIERDFGGGSSPYRPMYKLIEKASECIIGYSDFSETSPDAVRIDFFDAWEEVRAIDEDVEMSLVKQQVRRLTIEFLESLFDRVLPQGMNGVPENLKQEKFVERRARGVIIHDEGFAFPYTNELGVRIVREVSCPGISKPYLLIDGDISDFFTVRDESEKGAQYEPGEKLLFERITSKFANREIAEVLNSVFSRYQMHKVMTSKEFLEADGSDFNELFYVLFEANEFQSANEFHDVIRHNLISSWNKDTEVLINFIRTLGERTKENENEFISTDGDAVVRMINRPGRWKDKHPLEIVKDLKYEGGPVSKFVDYQVIRIAGREDEAREKVSFNFWDEGEKKTISFIRKYNESDNSMRFRISEEPKRPFYSRKMRLSVRNALSWNSHGSFGNSYFIGGLYLGPHIRKKILDEKRANIENDLALTIAQISHDRANNQTVFFELASEEGFLGLKDGSRIEGEIAHWSAYRSPIEGYNLLFDEDSG